MISNVSFGSMFNPERTGKGFNPEHNIEGLKNDAERPKDFPALPNDSIGRSQVKTSQILPHKLELTTSDKEFLSKLSSSAYGFHGNSNDFWFHTKKPTQGKIPELIMGDGTLEKDTTRHDYINKLVNSNTQAFQVAGKDNLGGNKLITVIKNTNTNTVTMYTCDSKQCYPMVLDSNTNMEKLASAITGNLDSIQGATIWEK